MISVCRNLRGLEDLGGLLEGRYTTGLSDMNNDPALPNMKIKTAGIGINAGITFPF